MSNGPSGIVCSAFVSLRRGRGDDGAVVVMSNLRTRIDILKELGQLPLDRAAAQISTPRAYLGVPGVIGQRNGNNVQAECPDRSGGGRRNSRTGGSAADTRDESCGRSK